MNCFRNFTQVVLSLATASLLVACGGSGNALAPAVDPEPTVFSVGRTSIEWEDVSRDERCGAQPSGTKRRLQAYLWYPADVVAGAAPAPLLNAQQIAVISALQETPSELLSTLSSNSHLEAPVSRRQSTYPVLLMSHGGGGSSPLQHASTAEALAAQGYVVVGLSHPHQSLVTFYASGDVAVLDPACDPLGAQPELGENATYQDHTANWLYTLDLDAYLTADFASAITQLRAMNRGQGPFAQRLELERIGAFGHSFGGSHAFRALRNIPGIVAAANMDGTVFSAEFAEGAGPGKAFLTILGADGSASITDPGLAAQIVAQLQALGMTLEQATEVAARGRPELAHAASSPAYLLTIPAARHMNFSDLGLWAEHGLAIDGDDINLPAARDILSLQNQVLVRFFNRHVRQRGGVVGLPPTALSGVTLSSH